MSTEKPNTPDAAELTEFMYRLGQGYLACGEQTALVELFLRRVASSLGMRRSRVVAFPTAIFISLHDGEREHVTLSEGPLHPLRLDQVAGVYTLGEEAQKGLVQPKDGLERLTAIFKSTTRYGTLGSLTGHVLLSMGLAAVLMPTITNILTCGVLGLIVGGVKILSRDRAVLDAPLSVISATVVSALVFLAINKGLPVDPLHALVPPLVTFLPGAMLTFGMVELAYGDMVSGASRLTAGLVQLVLLAFGLAAGATLIGYAPENLLKASDELNAIAWAPWLGVITFGVGVCMHFSAPRKSLLWVLLVLLVTFETQRIAAGIFGNLVSGFFGMLVATPLGYLIHLRFKGPPSMVTFLPSFWLLVPGSVGLLSVTRMLTDHTAGLEGLVGAIFAFASIALGTLVGASLYRWITERLGLWRLKIGRAARQPRPAKRKEARAPESERAPS